MNAVGALWATAGVVGFIALICGIAAYETVNEIAEAAGWLLLLAAAVIAVIAIWMGVASS